MDSNMLKVKLENNSLMSTALIVIGILTLIGGAFSTFFLYQANHDFVMSFLTIFFPAIANAVMFFSIAIIVRNQSEIFKLLTK